MPSVSEPSIKGSIVGPMAEEILALRDRGTIDAGDLEARLDREALALLERKVDPTSWVPLRLYEQLALLLQLLEGGRDEAYMRVRGERAGARLVDAGMYQQLKFVEKMREDASVEIFTTDMRLILSLQAALVNVGRWSVEKDPDHPGRVMVVVREAEAIPDCLARAIEGFFIGVSRRGHRVGIAWQMSRPKPGEICFRMDRDVAARG